MGVYNIVIKKFHRFQKWTNHPESEDKPIPERYSTILKIGQEAESSPEAESKMGPVK